MSKLNQTIEERLRIVTYSVDMAIEQAAEDSGLRDWLIREYLDDVGLSNSELHDAIIANLKPAFEQIIDPDDYASTII